jgi:hypothetical protein
VLECGGETQRHDWRIAATYAASATTILFKDGGVDLRRRAASVALERRIGERWTVQLAGGASIDGDLVQREATDEPEAPETPAPRHRLLPGPIAVAGFGYRLLDGAGRAPWLVVGASLAFTTGATRSSFANGRWTALDLRGSLVLGKTFGNAIAPYIALRAFGGPVFWNVVSGDSDDTRLGTDLHHVTFGGGCLVTTGRVDAFFEVLPLGERSASFGMAVSL